MRKCTVSPFFDHAIDDAHEDDHAAEGVVVRCRPDIAFSGLSRGAGGRRQLGDDGLEYRDAHAGFGRACDRLRASMPMTSSICSRRGGVDAGGQVDLVEDGDIRESASRAE